MKAKNKSILSHGVGWEFVCFPLFCMCVCEKKYRLYCVCYGALLNNEPQ